MKHKQAFVMPVSSLLPGGVTVQLISLKYNIYNGLSIDIPQRTENMQKIARSLPASVGTVGKWGYNGLLVLLWDGNFSGSVLNPAGLRQGKCYCSVHGAMRQRRKCCQSYFDRLTIPLGSMKFTDIGAFREQDRMKSFPLNFVSV